MAPRRIAGQNRANPSGLLLAGVMMLVHLGQTEVAACVHNAWLSTLEAGIHTADIYQAGISQQQVGTCEFADAVIAHLDQKPNYFKAAIYTPGRLPMIPPTLPRAPAHRELVGVDIFFDYENRNPNSLAEKLHQVIHASGLELVMITNRGVKVWPDGQPETFCTDHWRCRFMATKQGSPIIHAQIVHLLQRVIEAHLEFIKIENLCMFDGQPGYSLGQGQ